MATKKYVCKVCGYVHEGEKAPEVCPLCKAPASEFEVQGGDGKKKKGLNTNSDFYSVVYALVVVVIVAFMLAFVSSTLGETQQKNIQLDKKKQVLSSLNITAGNDDAAAAKYDEVVVKEYVVNSKGEVLDKKVDLIKMKNDEITKDNLPVYECKIDGETKYVLPMLGQGLWGSIWGYVAVNSDRNTIYGVYFSHSSETPGLGAEITSDKFKSQFPDKLLFVEDKPLAVQKGAKEGNVINAISGATITCNGVNAMIDNTLNMYKPFLDANKVVSSEPAADAKSEKCERSCTKQCPEVCKEKCEHKCTEQCTEVCDKKCEHVCTEQCAEACDKKCEHKCTEQCPEDCKEKCENCPKNNVEPNKEEVK